LKTYLHYHHFPKYVNHFESIQIQIWEFEYFHYRINSIKILLQKWIIWSYLSVQTILTPYHDPISCHPTLVDLAHIIQIQIEYLSKLYYILVNVFLESCDVGIHYTMAHMSRTIQIHYHLWRTISPKTSLSSSKKNLDIDMAITSSS
jgi:hypothetical protein